MTLLSFVDLMQGIGITDTAFLILWIMLFILTVELMFIMLYITCGIIRCMGSTLKHKTDKEILKGVNRWHTNRRV